MTRRRRRRRTARRKKRRKRTTLQTMPATRRKGAVQERPMGRARRRRCPRRAARRSRPRSSPAAGRTRRRRRAAGQPHGACACARAPVAPWETRSRVQRGRRPPRMALGPCAACATDACARTRASFRPRHGCARRTGRLLRYRQSAAAAPRRARPARGRVTHGRDGASSCRAHLGCVRGTRKRDPLQQRVPTAAGDARRSGHGQSEWRMRGRMMDRPLSSSAILHICKMARALFFA